MNAPFRPHHNDNRLPSEARMLAFLDWAGTAALILYLLSLLGLVAALWLGDGRAAFLFLGAMAAEALTLIAVGYVEGRLNG